MYVVPCYCQCMLNISLADMQAAFGLMWSAEIKPALSILPGVHPDTAHVPEVNLASNV